MRKIQKEDGNLKAHIEIDKYGITLLTSMNGWQFSGGCVNDNLLELIRDAINEHLDGA